MKQELILCMISAFAIFGTLILSLAVSRIIQNYLAWLDDKKPDKINFISDFLIRKFSKFKYKVLSNNKCFEGYSTEKDKTYCYVINKSYLHKMDIIFFYLIFRFFIISLVPFLILLIIKFYLVGSVIGVFIAGSFLARFTKRLSKKLKAHISDKNAHKNEE